MAADENETGQKTEQPTGRRLSQARTDGIVARSQDMSQVLGMVAAFIALQMLSPYIWESLVAVFRGSLSGKFTHEPLTIASLHFGFTSVLSTVLPIVFLLIVIAALFGAGSLAIQTGFLWSSKLLKPRFSMLNPISGLGRLLSFRNLFNIAKQVAKLCIIGPIAYFAFIELFPKFLGLMDVQIDELLPFTASSASFVFWRIIWLLFVLAIIDYAWQRFSTNKQLKMTKWEVKDERKAVEGDERAKTHIRAKSMQRVRKRMMEDVKKADVVVTNPTHLAIALQYSMLPGAAPQVVAKGRGHMAEKIKEVARKHGVPVLERKSLAQALFKTVEIGQAIPYELYAAVAEVLAYVYKLKGINPFRNRKAAARGSETTKH